MGRADGRIQVPCFSGTVAYVMNKLVPIPVLVPIAAALFEPVYDIVNR